MKRFRLKGRKWEYAKCKNCGLDVLIEHHPPGFTSHHQVPVCQAYLDLMAELKPDSASITEIHYQVPN